MIINSKDKTPNELYHLMIQTIIPRPIAWVISDNGNESYNLAPFSFFNGVSSNPPLICMSIGKKKEGDKKDTWKNIEERNIFVVNIPSREMQGIVQTSAEPLDFGESEIKANNLETIDFDEETKFPRLQICKAAFYCTKHQIIEIGNNPQGLVIGEIKKFYVNDDICKQDEKRVLIDAFRLNPLARLGGGDYAGIKVDEAFA